MGIIAYKCPNCGGELQFDPATQKYKCEYCSSLFEQDELDKIQMEVNFGDGLEKNDEDPDAVVYTCPNCGAQIVTDETTAATFCYYCHTPVVLSGRMEGTYHPDKIIPFVIDRKKALQIFDQWISRKKYVPKDFYNKDQIDKMTGVYFPYWLYDCKVESRIDAEGLKHNSWVVGSVRYTKTEKYDVSRDGDVRIANVTRNALSKANHQLVEGVLPFEMDKLQPFQMGFLAGFMAENRDMEKDRFADQVEQEVKNFAVSSIQNGITGYDTVNIRSQETKIADSDWKYTLLPVWTLTYKEPKTGKIYYFACNGQTGKVCGELPVDNGRLMKLFLTIFLPVFAVLLIVGYFL